MFECAWETVKRCPSGRDGYFGEQRHLGRGCQVSSGASPPGTSPGANAGSCLKGDYTAAAREGRVLLPRLN